METMNVNAYGAIRCIKGVLPTMRAQRSGTIVNHGSILGTTTMITGAPYCLSKFALEAISELLRIELIGMCIYSKSSPI